MKKFTKKPLGLDLDLDDTVELPTAKSYLLYRGCPPDSG